MPNSNAVTSKVSEVKDKAVQKVILKTALLAEKVNFLKPDNRPDDVIQFEHEVYGNKAMQLLGTRVFGETIGEPQRNSGYRPIFLSAIHVAPVLPFIKGNGDSYHGIPNGTTVLVVNEPDGKEFRVRWSDKTIKDHSFDTYFTRPATEAEISALLEGLFEARPMQTVALFTSSKFSESVDSATPEA